MRQFLLSLALLAGLAAGPSQALTIRATGTVTMLQFFGAAGGHYVTEFSPDDPRLENWAGAGLLSNVGSADLEVVATRSRFAMIGRSGCDGFLTLFCASRGVAELAPDNEIILPVHSAASNLQFRLTETNFVYGDDGRSNWSNATGAYNFYDGFRMVVAIDSLVRITPPPSSVPLPASWVLLAACLAGGAFAMRLRQSDTADQGCRPSDGRR